MVAAPVAFVLAANVGSAHKIILQRLRLPGEQLGDPLGAGALDQHTQGSGVTVIVFYLEERCCFDLTISLVFDRPGSGTCRFAKRFIILGAG